MNRQEFLNSLGKELLWQNDEDRQKTLEFYSESIDDRLEEGLTEDEAVADLGSIENIAESLKAEMPLTAVIKEKLGKQNTKSRGLWITLAIAGSPFWVPIAISLLAVALSVYIVLWSVIISVMALVFSFAACALGLVAAGVIFIALKSEVAIGIATFGAAVVCAGLFILTLKPAILLCKQTVKLTAKFGKFLKRKIRGEAK